jgi:hypothetical protein
MYSTVLENVNKQGHGQIMDMDKETNTNMYKVREHAHVFRHISISVADLVQFRNGSRSDLSTLTRQDPILPSQL